MTLAETYGLTNVIARPDWSDSGNPTPAPGTPTVLTSASGAIDYHSFLSMDVDSSDTLHLAWRAGSGHNTALDGTIRYQTKAYGGAWSSPETAVTLAEHPDDKITDPTVYPLPNGDVLCQYVTVHGTTGARRNWSKVRSGSWGAAVEFPNDFPSGQVTLGGRIDLWDSTLIRAVYARTGASGNRAIWTYQADTSAPTSWTQRGLVAPQGGSFDFEEPCILRRSDDLAVVLHRSDTDENIRRQWSPDLTRWAVPDIVFAGPARPHAGINPDDDILAVVRHADDGRPVYAYSSDRGRTFTTPAYLSDQTGVQQYGAVCWQRDHWVGVYGVEEDGATEFLGPANIYEIVFS